ncbi:MULTISPECIES: hypothetical protein [Rhodococcus erythropolis group]|uniref:Transposase n=1 Tax=Rhodococcus baikonurensis TaxID=172041 RepID=A0ABV5X8U0_9NOCA|nr:MULTISPECIES: hypothetical protein [Rhodococcus erythropolis group]MCD2109318.1 hypothetical protein [Rhodococcus qingshengii]MCZ4528243.1 hypothetical protein [Rhodococcus erythropolis]
MSELADGFNRTQMSREGNKIRIDCFIDDRFVYSALHPIEDFSNSFTEVIA